MHRGMGDILAELPGYVYTMWVYKATKLNNSQAGEKKKTPYNW